MANSDGFLAFVLDQLGPLDVTARKMFGEVGLYSGAVFFGIVAGDVLYLRVGAHNRASFEGVDSRPFRPFADRPASTTYFSVPPAVLESPDELVAWSRAAVRVAEEGSPTQRAPAAQPSKKARPRTSTAASSRVRTRR
jgi:DNA transformation protein